MWLANVRDIGIILLALESLVIGVLLALLLLQMRRLARMLEQELKPVLDSANEAATAVRGTTEIVSETLVSPLIRINSYLTGLRTGLETLLGIKSDLKGTPEAPSSEDSGTED